MVLLLSRNRTMALLFTGVDRDISEGCKHMSDGDVVQPALMSFFPYCHFISERLYKDRCYPIEYRGK